MDKARVCFKCDGAIPAGAQYCPRCGAKALDPRGRAETGLLATSSVLNHGRYVVLRKLAQGGQSAVYLVTDSATGSRVVIKELSVGTFNGEQRQAAVDAFMREASILMRLQHPYLCRL